MERLFKEHKTRKEISLNGLWNFKTDPGDIGEKQGWQNGLPDDAGAMFVPACWNLQMGLLDYHGAAWYTTSFETDCQNILLEFGAVNYCAEVFLDGKLLGTHKDGFLSFSFPVSGISKGTHLLAVRADNRVSNETIPHTFVDWYHYGGIIRGVTCNMLDDIYISDMKIEYDLDDNLKNASVNLSYTVVNTSENTAECPFELLVDDEDICKKTIILKAGENCLTESFTLNDIRLWDTFKPEMYTFCLKVQGDDMIDCTGFRSIKTKEGKLLLNGKELRLKGINRHEDHPDFGFAFPPQLMQRDIDIITGMGCNSIRGSHYPNSKIFLDLLDRQGIVFWIEIPQWGEQEEECANPVIVECGIRQHKQMVTQYRHHPSIIMWGLHNEANTKTQVAYEMTKAYAQTVRELDKSRPLTFATMYPLDDICLSLVDIISINKYFGWYEGGMEEWPKFLNNMRKKLEADGLSHLPVIISEFGAAALYGHHTFDNIKWTEEYQAKLLADELELFQSDPNICGTYIWQYCDLRTVHPSTDRARGFNNKGVVNEYRRPKASYAAIKQVQEKKR